MRIKIIFTAYFFAKWIEFNGPGVEWHFGAGVRARVRHVMAPASTVHAVISTLFYKWPKRVLMPLKKMEGLLLKRQPCSPLELVL